MRTSLPLHQTTALLLSTETNSTTYHTLSCSANVCRLSGPHHTFDFWNVSNDFLAFSSHAMIIVLSSSGTTKSLFLELAMFVIIFCQSHSRAYCGTEESSQPWHQVWLLARIAQLVTPQLLAGACAESLIHCLLYLYLLPGNGVNRVERLCIRQSWWFFPLKTMNYYRNK